MFGSRRGSTSAGGKHIGDEVLSSYIDGYLSPGEAASVQDHLAKCKACVYSMGTLQETAMILRRLPQVKVPRAFTLTEADVAPQRTHQRGLFVFLRAATAAVAMLLAVVIAGDLLIHQGMPASVAPRQMAEWFVESEAFIPLEALPEERAALLDEERIHGLEPSAAEETGVVGLALEAEPLEETVVLEVFVTEEQPIIEADRPVDTTPALTPEPPREPVVEETGLTEKTLVTAEMLPAESPIPETAPAAAQTPEKVGIAEVVPVTATATTDIPSTPAVEDTPITPPVGIAEVEIPSPTETRTPSQEEIAAMTAAPRGLGEMEIVATGTPEVIEEASPALTPSPEPTATLMATPTPTEEPVATPLPAPISTPTPLLEEQKVGVLMQEHLATAETPATAIAEVRLQQEAIAPSDRLALATTATGLAPLFRLAQVALVLILGALGTAMLVSRQRR